MDSQLKYCSITVVRWQAKCLLLLVAILVGCESPPVVPTQRDVIVRVEPSVTESISARSVAVMFYPIDAEGFGVRLDGEAAGTIEIPEGRYDLICYTSDFYDVDATFYRGMERYHTAEAYSQQKARRTYGRNASITEYLTLQSDPLHAYSISNKVFTASDWQLACPMRPLTYLYKFTVRVSGMEHMKSASASLSGMYTSVYLADGKHNTLETAVVIGNLMRGDGVLHGELRCFGSHQSRTVEHRIVISTVGASTETHDLGDLTAAIKALPRGGEIAIEREIIIGQGDASDGGFNAGVGQWDEVIVDLPL